MPPVALRPVTDRHWWFLGYEQTYLERDVRELSQVGDLITFRNFLRLAALRTGQVLNQSDIARDAKLSSSTAARYLSLLEASFIIHRLPPFLRNKASRLIKSPKLFMSDSGIAAHLTGVKELGPLSDEPLRGRLFETFVAQNLAGILASHSQAAELCFWHVQGRQEVAFVIAAGRRSLAIEVKAASRFDDGDLAGLRAFAAATPGGAAQVLAYNGTEAVSLGDRLYAIPLALLLS